MKTDLSQVTDKLYLIMLYRVHLAITRIHKRVVMGTNCTFSCKSNYHSFMTAPEIVDTYLKVAYGKRGRGHGV